MECCICVIFLARAEVIMYKEWKMAQEPIQRLYLAVYGCIIRTGPNELLLGMTVTSRRRYYENSLIHSMLYWVAVAWMVRGTFFSTGGKR